MPLGMRSVESESGPGSVWALDRGDAETSEDAHDVFDVDASHGTFVDANLGALANMKVELRI